ncbi:hypothetical protein CO174_01620 [Candidatus Uhrbacteria bacterium CG_4_9_14_3_um_filter_50_9]|uniref:Nudix hydrolase domain-containing protein n=1 Tax=Candidatus Uhrbacteria bacterium CG_4_9_14_3_um_filter_50_9 TaxID=1975035 RepID=A0A2M7XD42_9BACT|nr:MAG: hypothetical protein CO174_01620 [Candidatus Uhrbacteria bacterium CG_4_9_14_3_um_filter_50_9]
MNTKPLRVLITGGGTKVRIDDVRHLGNFSKGGFASAIGQAFIAQGAEVTLIGSREMLERMEFRGEDQDYKQLIPYRWFEELEQELFDAIEREQPDVILMAAAVSDWLCKDARDGKISSDAQEMTLMFTRAPKLLARLREACGVKTFITGFKLLAGAPHEELMAKAHTQVQTNRLNLTIANDLSEFKDDAHPITFVTPEGGEIRVEGSRDEVADQIAQFITKRERVRWSKSLSVGDAQDITSDSEACEQIARLLDLTRNANIFDGSSGNLSWRAQDGGFWVSPRKVDKRELTPEHMVLTRTDSAKQCVEYFGEAKPSIDSSVQGYLYNRFPWIHGLLHFHDGFILPDSSTNFPFPCGTLEEAEEIGRTIEPMDTPQDPFSIELPHHGFLVALGTNGAKKLIDEWISVLNAYIQHLREVGHDHRRDEVNFFPVFFSGHIIGIVAQHKREKWISIFLHPEIRRSGYGEQLVRLLDQKGLYVNVDDNCHVRDYYIARGWKPVSRDNTLTLLQPPSLRTDLREAVTVCIVKPSTHEVLLGQRQTASWNQMWAMIGGAVDPAEEGQPLVTAKREAYEEVRMDSFPEIAPVSETICTVGTNEGKKAYRVRTLIYFVDTFPHVEPSEEMVPGIFPLNEALKLPMGAGTKYVLRHVEHLLDTQRKSR